MALSGPDEDVRQESGEAWLGGRRNAGAGGSGSFRLAAGIADCAAANAGGRPEAGSATVSLSLQQVQSQQIGIGIASCWA